MSEALVAGSLVWLFSADSHSASLSTCTSSSRSRSSSRYAGVCVSLGAVAARRARMHSRQKDTSAAARLGEVPPGAMSMRITCTTANSTQSGKSKYERCTAQSRRAGCVVRAVGSGTPWAASRDSGHLSCTARSGKPDESSTRRKQISVLPMRRWRACTMRT